MARLVIGSGQYTYEVVRPWGRLPAKRRFGIVSHVAVDSEDRVYVYQRDDPPVLVFDRDGDFLGSWGQGMNLDAHGIYITPEDHVYLVNRDAHEVLKFTADGRLLMRLGTAGKPSLQGPFNHPADVAVSSKGDVYVADGYGNSRIHKFSPDGTLVLSWGAPGRGPGQFRVPHGVWVDSGDRVHVADRENGRVQVFTSEGEFVTEWPDFYRPTDVYVDSNGTVYVTDLVPRVSILNREGELLARGRPVLDTAHGIWGDSRGDLYVAEAQSRQVTKLVRRRA